MQAQRKHANESRKGRSFSSCTNATSSKSSSNMASNHALQGYGSDIALPMHSLVLPGDCDSSSRTRRLLKAKRSTMMKTCTIPTSVNDAVDDHISDAVMLGYCVWAWLS